MADATGLRENLRGHADRLADAAVRTGVVPALRRAAPIDTGETAEKISSRRVAGPPRITHEVEAPTPQGEWAENGTRAHPIVARNAKALVFYWPKVGRVVAFKHVNHPGQPPRPWFAPTLRAEWPASLRRLAASS